MTTFDTTDWNEANSLRYGKKAFWLLPLSSGHFAILTPNRSIYAIVHTIEEALEVGPLAEASQIETKLYARASILDSNETAYMEMELDL